MHFRLAHRLEAAMSQSCGASAGAATGTVRPTAPTCGGAFAVSNVAVPGVLDVSYHHRGGGGQFLNDNPSPVFDARRDSSSPHQAAGALDYQPRSGGGAVVKLIAGQDSDGFVPCDIDPGAHSKLDFAQAYVQYATAPLTVIAGRFVTLAGAEAIDPRTAANFPRSVPYGLAIPFARAGARATLAASDPLTVNVGVVNSWDDLKDTNSAKTAERAAAVTPAKVVSLVTAGHFGKARDGGLTGVGPEGQRELVDVVAAGDATASLSAIPNYDGRGRDGGPPDAGRAHGDGLAGYLNCAFNARWRASLHSESLQQRGRPAHGVRAAVTRDDADRVLAAGRAARAAARRLLRPLRPRRRPHEQCVRRSGRGPAMARRPVEFGGDRGAVQVLSRRQRSCAPPGLPPPAPGPGRSAIGIGAAARLSVAADPARQQRDRMSDGRR